MSYNILNPQDYKQIGICIINKSKNIKYRLIELDEYDKLMGATHRLASLNEAPYVKVPNPNQGAITEPSVLIHNNVFFNTFLVKKLGPCTFVEIRDVNSGDEAFGEKLYFSEIIEQEPFLISKF